MLTFEGCKQIHNYISMKGPQLCDVLHYTIYFSRGAQLYIIV